jgi:hypothetical protein
MIFLRTAALFILGTFSFASAAADYPAPKEGDWIARDFKFHTGEVLPEMRLHYMTIGKPDGIPVVVLHGTGSSGQSMLTPAFAGELFGPADDERNPPETGITEAAMKRVRNGKLLLIPASEQTSGHGTTANAKFYKQALQEFLSSAPQKGM